MHNLIQRINEYLMAGLKPPVGMLEEFEKKKGKKFRPSQLVSRVYTLITGKKYE